MFAAVASFQVRFDQLWNRWLLYQSSTPLWVFERIEWTLFALFVFIDYSELYSYCNFIYLFCTFSCISTTHMVMTNVVDCHSHTVCWDFLPFNEFL